MWLDSNGQRLYKSWWIHLIHAQVRLKIEGREAKRVNWQVNIEIMIANNIETRVDPCQPLKFKSNVFMLTVTGRLPLKPNTLEYNTNQKTTRATIRSWINKALKEKQRQFLNEMEFLIRLGEKMMNSIMNEEETAQNWA